MKCFLLVIQIYLLQIIINNINASSFNGFPFEEDFILVKNVPSRSRRQVKVDIEMTTSGTTSELIISSQLTDATTEDYNNTTTFTTLETEQTTFESISTESTTQSSSTYYVSIITSDETTNNEDTTKVTTENISSSSNGDTTESTATTTTTTTTSISTTTTTTSTTTTSTTTTMKTTTSEDSQLYPVEGEVSIKNQVLFSIDGFSLNLASTPILFSSGAFSNLKINKNGYIVLSNVISARSIPYQSFDPIKVPLLAPFWSDLYYDTISDITLGNLTSNLKSFKNELLNDIAVFDSFGGENFTPDFVAIVTFKNLKPFSSSTNYISFQIAIAQQYKNGKAYVVFSYEKNNINSRSVNKQVLIGLTDGKKSITNAYSNMDGSNTSPYSIFNVIGNCKKLGRFVYDISYLIPDKCERWYYSALQLGITSNLLEGYKRDRRSIACPTNRQFAVIDRNFALYQRFFRFSSGVECYVNVFTNGNLKQLCCYNSGFVFFFGSGELITTGEFAGFLFNSRNYNEVFQQRLDCCSNKPWQSCQRFYAVYPVSSSDGYVAPLPSWGGGDPHIRTFDGLTYTFNGLGRFILAKSQDQSFEVQSQTNLFTNINNQLISGTFFNGFAMKSLNSPIIEIKLSDSFAQNPYLMLYIDKTKSSTFTQNFEFDEGFPEDNPLIFVKQDENAVTVAMENGILLYISIATTVFGQNERVSWLSCDIYIKNNIKNFTSALEGLMGNYNQNQDDDIFWRNGTISSNITSEKAIYPIADTWRISDDDTSFFYDDLTVTARDQMSGYKPTFVEDILIDAKILEKCKNDLQCAIDATLTGLVDVGISTQNKLSKIKNDAVLAAKKPPQILFKESVINIDLKKDKTIIIFAEIFDEDSFDSLSVTLNVTNASDYSFKNVTNSKSNKTIEITYYPKINEYPIFNIIAEDEYFVSSNTIKLRICDCSSKDSKSQCLFEEALEFKNIYVNTVKCKCSDLYTGNNCDNYLDYCNAINPCNANLTCKSSDELSDDKKLYFCDGACPNGYNKYENGECVDINECLESNACPTGSECVNSIGSYTCICVKGYKYSDNKCQDIDECAEATHKCDSICVNTEGSYVCSCYTGYKLVNNTACIKDESNPIVACDDLSCSQICTTDNKNLAICKCNLGYTLNENQKDCDDINECLKNKGRCSDDCTNTIGSYYCTCPIGKTLDSDKKTCIQCPPNTYGERCSKTCNCQNSLKCDSISGCICLSGYTGTFCETDINECESQPPYYYSQCINTPGSFRYECLPGFQSRSNDLNCYDINECVETPDICPQNSVCNNTIGGYNCNCKTGYVFDKSSCADINECLKNPCTVNSLCSNIIGNYECRCQPGFIKKEGTSDTAPACDDINECASQNTCASNQNCVNTIGSFKCDCKPGYVYMNATCVDIDECKMAPCSVNETCTNSVGNYSCQCSKYFVRVNDVCLFQQRSTNNVTFQLIFKNFDCINTTNTTSFLSNIKTTIQNLFSNQNILNDTIPSLQSCVSNNATVSLSMLFNSMLDPYAETNVVLALARLKNVFDESFLFNEYKKTFVPLKNADECITFTSYEQCTHSSFCEVSSGKPSCKCLFDSKNEYKGAFCEIPQKIIPISTTTTKPSSDDTTLILAIILPIIALLIIIITAIITIFFCYRKYKNSIVYEKYHDEIQAKKKFIIPRVIGFLKKSSLSSSSSNNAVIRTNLNKSDFEFEKNDDNPEIQDDDLIKFDDDITTSVSKDEYRATYPLEQSSIKQENDNYFKSLESNASIKQTSTIARPSSIFTDSAFSLPTAYHEKTTPYGDYNDPGLDDSFDGFEGNEIEDDDDFSEVIEAINPNVQIPRPKIQKYPQNIFK